MSWDILIQDFGSYRSLEEIPDDFQPGPLGLRIELANRVKEIAPQADFSDLAWGIIETGNCSIEFNMGADEPCSSIMLHIRGGDDAVPLTSALIDHLGFHALDMQTSEFYSEEAATHSFGQWSAYRDRVIGEVSAPKSTFWERLRAIFG